MEIFSSLLDTFAYFETHMDALFLNHGRLTLWILALVIFSETAFVVTPFLPGDSLLLATGALAATGSMEFHILIIALTAAAFLGNVCNYWIGYFIGKKAFHNPKSKIFNEENLQKTHQFYEKYGGLTIILSRFLPFIRAFAPFVAGIARMDFRLFMIRNFNLHPAIMLRFRKMKTRESSILCALNYFNSLFNHIPAISRNFCANNLNHLPCKQRSDVPALCQRQSFSKSVNKTGSIKVTGTCCVYYF